MTKESKIFIFTFSILKFIEWDINNRTEISPFSSIEELLEKFSKENNFSKLKLQLLPHYLCTANGNRKAMFEIFTSFFADVEIGYIENDISNYIVENDNFLSIIHITEDKLAIKDVDCIINLFSYSTDDTNNKYLVDPAKYVSLFSKQYNEFSESVHNDGLVENANDFLTKEIPHSVKSLKDQDYSKNGGVLKMDGEILSKLSKVHFVYKHLINEAKRDNTNVLHRLHVETKFLMIEKSIFSSNPEQRINNPFYELL